MGEIGITAFAGIQGAVAGENKDIFARIGGLVPGIAGATGAAVGVAKVWSSIMMLALGSLFVFGAMLSIYLPMIPFIVWMGALMTWLATVVEGVVAAPLWAFAHMDAEGEGMGQRTTHGYLFILNVLFRPFLMVTGFLLMTILINVVGGLYLYLFPMAMASVQMSSATGVISIVGYIGVFMSGCLAIVNIGANMIHAVPNMIDWIGGQANSFGDHMQDHTKGAASGLGQTSTIAGQVMKGKVAEGTEQAKALKGAEQALKGGQEKAAKAAADFGDAGEK